MDTRIDLGSKGDFGQSALPSQFGHYRLERELGRGFSSIVYEATDLRRPRVVALKVLTFLQTLSEDRRTDLAERFRREAQAVSALSHPNIVAIYEVDQIDDGRQFIAMECLPGETLRRRLHRVSPLAISEAVPIAIRIADALHYAHGRGIIHRDIKPDNIFLAGSAETETTPKLMDFGIAHVLSDQGLTQDGTIVGSPAYMSPEQINGLPLDVRTDVFSLAVTLTEMVTGAKPFEAETIPAVMQQILHHAPNLRAVPDKRLGRVLAKALAKNPGARYADAAAFGEALRQTVPLNAPLLSDATQIVPVLAMERVAIKSRLPISWGAVALGGLALATLAALPRLASHPQPQTVVAASRPSTTTVRLVADPGAQRHEIPATWHPSTPRAARRATPRTAYLTPKPDAVRIAEVTPRHRGYSYLPQATRVPHPPAAPSRPAQPAKPAVPNAPLLAASSRPTTVESASAKVRKPIVRVAGIQQELPLAARPQETSLSETKPVTEGKPTVDQAPAPTPPRAQILPDSPPRALQSPMPQALADFDGRSAIVRLRLTVDENGDVTDATILVSSGSRALDDATLDAVGHWEYAPAIKNGQSVPGIVVETVKFAR